jgi:DNA-binding NarL/FixJ family response regulator
MVVGERLPEGALGGLTSVRILIVDDSNPWRKAVCSILEQHLDLVVICESSDGLEAGRKSEESQPDLVLLDIGLPNLNGLEAARKICQVAPGLRILFFSSHNWPELLHEAMSIGALGFVVKSEAKRDLLLVIRAVMRIEQFVDSGFSLRDPIKPLDT